MVQDNPSSNQSNPTCESRTLLRKYEIPIDQLSYEYIGTCNDVKKLERIVRILRSGEEGYFPDLQRTAENRLRLLNPNSRQLREEKPVLTRANMDKEEWMNVVSDLECWKVEVAMKDFKLTEGSDGGEDESYLPPVRQPQPPPDKNPDKDELSKQKMCVKRRTASDFAAWDKYDPDVELLKMDLEEERAAEKKKIKEAKMNEAQPVAIESRIEEVRRQAEKLSELERQMLAEQKKKQGNEYYRAKDYVEALQLYSESVEVWPNPDAYNNRAECNLKLRKYAEALNDACRTIGMQKDNVKAHFRRGLAHWGLQQFDEAHCDMCLVARLDPKNTQAKEYVDQLRLIRQTAPRITRMVEDDQAAGIRRIVETTREENMRTELRDDQSEVNYAGLPKYEFSCFDSKSIPTIRQPLSGHKQIPVRSVPQNTRLRPKIVEIIDEPEMPKPISSTRMSIIEVNKMETDEKSGRKKVVIDKRTKLAPTKNIDVAHGEGDEHNNEILNV